MEMVITKVHVTIMGAVHLTGSGVKLASEHLGSCRFLIEIKYYIVARFTLVNDICFCWEVSQSGPDFLTGRLGVGGGVICHHLPL